MGSMLEKCKESLLVVRRIAESTTDDEAMLFEALNLHDELQQVISRCEEMGSAALDSVSVLTKTTSDSIEPSAPLLVENHNSKPETAESTKLESDESSSEVKKTSPQKEENTESGLGKGNVDQGIRLEV